MGLIVLAVRLVRVCSRVSPPVVAWPATEVKDDRLSPALTPARSWDEAAGMIGRGNVAFCPDLDQLLQGGGRMNV